MRISPHTSALSRHDILWRELNKLAIGTSCIRRTRNKPHVDISLNNFIRAGLRDGMTVNNCLCMHFGLQVFLEKGIVFIGT
jgi:hypothetical protein